MSTAARRSPKRCDPGLDPLAARAQALAEPVVQVVRRRWPVRPEVRLDRTHSSLIEVRHAGPARVAIQTLEGRTSVSRRAEAHVSLPRERLQQRPGPIGEGEAQMPEPGPGRDGGSQLVAGHRPVGERLSDSLAKERPVGRRQAVVLCQLGSSHIRLAARKARYAPPSCGRHQVGGAAKRKRLDDPAVGQGTSDLARPGPFAPGADGELGRGIELGRDGAEAAHDACDRFGADRVEQLLPHTPRKGAGPAERHAQTITGLTRVPGAAGLEPRALRRDSSVRRLSGQVASGRRRGTKRLACASQAVGRHR